MPIFLFSRAFPLFFLSFIHIFHPPDDGQLVKDVEGRISLLFVMLHILQTHENSNVKSGETCLAFTSCGSLLEISSPGRSAGWLLN